MEEFWKILRQSSPVIFLCVFGELIAGIALVSSEKYLEIIPGLLILLPSVLSLRGNISSALGSRLGSAIHLGLIDSEVHMNTFRNPLIIQNVYASLTLNLVMSFVAGIAAYYVSIAIGVSKVSIIVLTSISVIAGVLSGLMLTFLTIYLAVYTSAKGLDPDNVLTPAVATVGDIFTVLFLLLSAKLVLAFI